MKKTLQNPSAREKPLPKHYLTPKEIFDLPYEKSLTALADYDGPIRSLLERMISMLHNFPFPPDQFGAIPIPKEITDGWLKEAKEIMNVVYKLNGLKDRWET